MAWGREGRSHPSATLPIVHSYMATVGSIGVEGGEERKED
jgi:hypothetical protein